MRSKVVEGYSAARRAGRAGLAMVLAVSGCRSAPKGIQFPPTRVTVATVAPQTVPAHFLYQGVAQASKHIVVSAQVAGVIVSRPFVEGTDVAQGTLLYLVDTTQYAAALRTAIGNLENARARLVNADISLRRARPLLADRAIAQATVDSAEQIYRQAQADVAADEGSVDQARKSYHDCFVRAPVTGRVGIAYLVLGSRVTGPSDSLTTLDQIDPLYVEFNPPYQDILAWRRQIAAKALTFPSARLRVRAHLEDGSVFEQPGTLDFAGISVQAQTGTQTLRATFRNPGHILLPGAFVKVELLDLKRDAAMLVPQRAVQQGLTGAYVYVVGDSDKVAIRPVLASTWFGSQWMVDSGIKAGDRVVVDGTQKIFPGAKVAPVPYAGDTTSQAAPAPVPAAPAIPLGSGRQ